MCDTPTRRETITTRPTLRATTTFTTQNPRLADRDAIPHHRHPIAFHCQAIPHRPQRQT